MRSHDFSRLNPEYYAFNEANLYAQLTSQEPGVQIGDIIRLKGVDWKVVELDRYSDPASMWTARLKLANPFVDPQQTKEQKLEILREVRDHLFEAIDGLQVDKSTDLEYHVSCAIANLSKLKSIQLPVFPNASKTV